MVSVMCAHCGKIYKGDSESLVWFQAKACAGSHQVMTYEYAPKLKPVNGIEAGIDPDSERPR